MTVSLILGFRQAFDTTIHPVTSLQQLSNITGIRIPEGSTLIEGRYHPSGGMAPGGLWAVVRLRPKAVPAILKQSRLDGEVSGAKNYFEWGLTLPQDQATKGFKPQVEAIEHSISARGGSLAERGGSVQVLVDLDDPSAPTAYVSWGTN
jgi:hypothetical protein